MPRELAPATPDGTITNLADCGPTEGNDVDLAYLLFSLACPLSMVALVGWWFWSMRGSGSKPQPAPVRSAAEEGEITRMRAQLDQLDARSREQRAPSTH